MSKNKINTQYNIQKNITKKDLYILLLITKNNFGGAQKYVFDLATTLKEKHNFKIKVATGKNVIGFDPLLDINLTNSNIEIIKINSLSNSLNPINLIKQIIEIRKVLKKENPDIIHINSNMAGLSGMLASIFLPVKKVFTAHGWTFNENRNFIMTTIFKILSHIIVLLSDKTITVSNKTKNDLHKIVHKKITTIYNGIDNKNTDKIENDKFIDTAILEKINNTKILHNNTNTNIHLVSIGELHHVKGHDIVIEALSKLQEQGNDKKSKIKFIYHILGEGNFRKNLEEQIKLKNLSNTVILHGYVKNAKSYLEHFDIFIVPSRSEALGYVLIEGFQSNLPIIHTDVGGMPEVRAIFKNHYQNANKNKITDNDNKIENNDNKIENSNTNSYYKINDKQNIFEQKYLMIKCNVDSFLQILNNKNILSQLLQNRKLNQNTHNLTEENIINNIPQSLTKDQMILDTIEIYKNI